jgi:hypothetical protein
MRPLSRFQGRTVTADDLLALAPPAGLDQLARFREVFESILLTQLASRTGLWKLGPAFAAQRSSGTPMTTSSPPACSWSSAASESSNAYTFTSSGRGEAAAPQRDTPRRTSISSPSLD